MVDSYVVIGIFRFLNGKKKKDGTPAFRVRATFLTNVVYKRAVVGIPGGKPEISEGMKSSVLGMGHAFLGSFPGTH